MNNMNNIEDEDDEDEIKVILIGETGTGKTSLINTSIGLEFQEKFEPTQSSSIVPKKMKINNKEYTINLWDTIGQEQYRALNKIFMKGAKIVIFVYDITSKKTFDELDFWFDNTKEVLGDSPILAIIGNKTDLYFNEEVKEEMADEYAKKKGVPLKLTSAKTPKIFCEYLEELVKKYIKKTEERAASIAVPGIKINEADENKQTPKKKGKCC